MSSRLDPYFSYELLNFQPFIGPLFPINELVESVCHSIILYYVCGSGRGAGGKVWGRRGIDRSKFDPSKHSRPLP